nr:retrovirus-related Pol polyprotein from transposon TNT 1-94 [Tanacetum cinerariifolium]
MAAGQSKPEGQWTGDERKAAKLDQRLKSIIMTVLPDDQMNSVINCLTTKSTWDDLILYHEAPFNVKESRVMDLKLCYNTFKSKEAFFSTSIVQNFQDSPDEEEDTRSSYEYLDDLKEEYQARALLAKSKRFFKKDNVSITDSSKPRLSEAKDFTLSHHDTRKEGKGIAGLKGLDLEKDSP